jgi:capsular exopolysaccharide synthesis family protein
MHPHDAARPDPREELARRREPSAVAGRLAPPSALLPREPQAAPPGLSAAPDLPALLRALRRRWMTAVALAIPFAALAAVGAWFLMTPKATAFSLIRVAYDPPKLLAESQVAGQNVFSNYLRTQAAQIKSRPVIAAALKRDDVKRLGLEKRWTDPAAAVEEEIKVEFQEPAEFLTVLFSGPDAAEALALVKAVTAAYMDEVVYAEQRARVARVAELEKVANELGEGHKTKKANLRRLAESLGTTSEAVLTQQQIELLASLRDARGQRNAARADVHKAEAALAAHVARTRDLKAPPVPATAVEAALKTEDASAQLLSRAARCRDIIKDYQTNAVNPREPTRVRAERELKKAEAKLEKRRAEVRAELAAAAKERAQAEADSHRVDLESHLGTVKAFHDKVHAEVEKMVADSSKIGQSSTELEHLRDEIKRESRILDDVGERLEKLRLELRSPQRISVYQDAELQRQNMKKQVMATAAAPLFVLFAVCMGVAVLEHRKRRILGAGDVAGGLGIRVVGAVPHLARAERQVLTPEGELDDAGHLVLESIDALRTQLLHETAEAARVVLVTSAAPGEGKTTLAAALAASLARAGRRTLLIDGDLRRPAVHQLFELPLQPGFSEVLLDEVETGAAVQETAVENLSVVAAGEWDREVLHSLARDGVNRVFDKLCEEFDFLIIDSHPILPAADSLLLAQRVDAVILSVLREVSQGPRVWTACQRLQALGIRVRGAVVPGADPEEVVPPPGAYAHADAA